MGQVYQLPPAPTTGDATNIITQFSQDVSDAVSSGARAVFQMQPDVYETTEPLDLRFQGDTRCLLDIGVEQDYHNRVQFLGWGKRLATIHQKDSTKPCIRLDTTGGNVRDLLLRDLCLLRGSVGIEVVRGAYNGIRDIQFDKQWGAAIKMTVGIASVTNSWFVHGHKIASVTSGTLNLGSCYLGEDIGCIDVLSGHLNMTGCQGHSISAKASSQPEGQQAFIDLRGGGGCFLANNDLGFIGGDALVRAEYSRDILLESNRLRIGNMPHAIIGRTLHSGTKPYPTLAVRGGAMISTRVEPFQFYKAVTGHVPHVHRDSVIDTVIQVRDKPQFSWGPEFEAAGQSLSRSLVVENTD